MSLKDRRGEYSWPKTRVAGVQLMADRRSYALADTIKVRLGFRVVGGLREAFHPDVWTVAWEDFDKIVRLTIRMSLGLQSGLRARRLAEVKKDVRKASFYWSRDPDLPYRIWAMIVPEDGGPPIIPANVEDAQKQMLDVERTFEVPASKLGRGEHRLVGDVYAKWGRRSFIEKGEAASRSKPLVVKVD
jgi:hypothetical protein